MSCTRLEDEDEDEDGNDVVVQVSAIASEPECDRGSNSKDNGVGYMHQRAGEKVFWDVSWSHLTPKIPRDDVRNTN